MHAYNNTINTLNKTGRFFLKNQRDRWKKLKAK